MQCDKKPQLLRNVQIQALAVESEKTEAEDSVEVCKKWEVATMTDILMIVSVCGQISWNNSTNDWPASSLQHCACIRLLRQVTEQGEANKSLNTRLVSVVNFVRNLVYFQQQRQILIVDEVGRVGSSYPSCALAHDRRYSLQLDSCQENFQQEKNYFTKKN